MYRIPREEVDRLKKHDICLIKTVSGHVATHNAPDLMEDKVPAENPFEGPYWVTVKHGNLNSKNWVEVLAVGQRIATRAIEDPDFDSDFVYRPEENIRLQNHEREEKVEWNGTPQSRLDPKHNEVVNEEDVRGSKNELLGGHQ